MFQGPTHLWPKKYFTWDVFSTISVVWMSMIKSVKYALMCIHTMLCATMKSDTPLTHPIIRRRYFYVGQCDLDYHVMKISKRFYAKRQNIVDKKIEYAL